MSFSFIYNHLLEAIRAIRRRWLYVEKIVGKNITEQDMESFLSNASGNAKIIFMKLKL